MTPENFSVCNVSYFLKNIESVFKLENVQQENVLFDVSRTKKIDLLGQLLIYKFLDFSRIKKCFRNPKTNLKNIKYVSDEMKKMGFKNLVDENFLMSSMNEDIPAYSERDGFFIAPIVLEKERKVSLVNSIEKRIISYYDDASLSSGILQCIGEISSNFQEHAVSDTRSVLVARGNKSQVEIACADNGEGIITSLMPSLSSNYRSHAYDVLREAIKENVTSKPSAGHMGCGLWIVNEFVTSSKGYMTIFSEGAYLINKKGVIKCGQSSFWKGTIIYVNMPLTNNSIFLDVMRKKEKSIQSKHDNLELKFI